MMTSGISNVYQHNFVDEYWQRLLTIKRIDNNLIFQCAETAVDSVHDNTRRYIEYVMSFDNISIDHIQYNILGNFNCYNPGLADTWITNDDRMYKDLWLTINQDPCWGHFELNEFIIFKKSKGYEEYREWIRFGIHDIKEYSRLIKFLQSHIRDIFTKRVDK